ncbi:hypothetical protein [Rhodanobacter aciditrophus]|uniref:hypothetical protein n=1 Tax=Rhodanobacter aciditrophus TaxID=1623218 RepID=UPI003CE91B9C
MNKYVDHVQIVLEDDANRELVNGFLRHHAVDVHRFGISPPSGGWLKVLEEFESYHIKQLRKFDLRRVVLIIDFDGKFEERIERLKGRVPEDLLDRVFILGTGIEPEALRAAMGMNLEAIGLKLAGDCASGEEVFWGHELLRHNLHEARRLNAATGYLFRE